MRNSEHYKLDYGAFLRSIFTTLYSTVLYTDAGCGRQERLGGSTDGVSVQPCWWRYEDSPAYHFAYEVQCNVRGASLLFDHWRPTTAGGGKDFGRAAGANQVASCLTLVYLSCYNSASICKESNGFKFDALQAYIEAENLRLEREVCQFWEKEVILKIEYKFCPNLTIIDTPGLISAAPGRKNQSLQVCQTVGCLLYCTLVFWSSHYLIFLVFVLNELGSFFIGKIVIGWDWWKLARAVTSTGCGGTGAHKDAA